MSDMLDKTDCSEMQNNNSAATASRTRTRRNSFFLHLRPASYPRETVSFSNTWFLGFFSVFFIVLECITGAILMVYYVPSPAEAYDSIIRLQTEVPFGSLFRDLHRLGGELMIAAVILHMFRTYIAGAHNGRKTVIWLTGIVLLVLTLMLGFSGYLLPWDQLAYWAITIGTSMAQTIPFIGDELLLFLRGGPEFGLDGLLRFYLLHIIVLPACLFVFLFIHYYKVIKLRPATPLLKENRDSNDPTRRLPLFPNVILLELLLSLATLTILLFTVTFFYDAPLEHHADPLHTPAKTAAPWFFLWLQGALKLGDSFIMGICLPLLLLLFLTMLPYIDISENRKFNKYPVIMAGTALFITGLTVLTFIGLPNYANSNGPIAEIIEQMVPEEAPSVFHSLEFNELSQGVFESNMTYEDISDDFKELLFNFNQKLHKLSSKERIEHIKGIIIVQDWQANLKRITLRVSWQNQENDKRNSLERIIYIHRATVGSATKKGNSHESN